MEYNYHNNIDVKWRNRTMEYNYYNNIEVKWPSKQRFEKGHFLKLNRLQQLQSTRNRH